uniref:C3H1-type domain-containing protein n=1 Tax=Chromera velia CCMP2878 TaxID=1169474 RepID=A0A0G4I8S5_9ALVE|eukprot:Cvel_11944.t1-p1 / transcript=Cvel_11944.t1 / gene=Cvel_11944 / organism=Chromera_velia_CCMP2878 / gene_product=hypothetical protein / transcript_product=hypothetical protein / location=Cvel_scaffold765:28649-29487(+) / protein_length=252 / sequence_SO=supercontig / SO=protein_coding / is_pseudo=false
MRPAKQGPAVCRHFERGHCRLGDACKFRHESGTSRHHGGGGGGGAGGGGVREGVGGAVGEVVEEGAGTLDPALSTGRQMSQMETGVVAWREFDALNFDGLSSLVSALARLPFSVSCPPPPLQLVEKAVGRFLSEGCRDGTTTEEISKVVETVVNVVDRLLKFEWMTEEESLARSVLQNTLTDADRYLQKKEKDHRAIGQLIMKKLEDWRNLRSPGRSRSKPLCRHHLPPGAVEEETPAHTTEGPPERPLLWV